MFFRLSSDVIVLFCSALLCKHDHRNNKLRTTIFVYFMSLNSSTHHHYDQDNNDITADDNDDDHTIFHSLSLSVKNQRHWLEDTTTVLWVFSISPSLSRWLSVCFVFIYWSKLFWRLFLVRHSVFFLSSYHHKLSNNWKKYLRLFIVEIFSFYYWSAQWTISFFLSIIANYRDGLIKKMATLQIGSINDQL